MYPIILVHGIARFDVLLQIQREKLGMPEEWLNQFHYFKNIASFLATQGFSSVFHSNEDFAGPVELRAIQLRDRVAEVLQLTGAAKVHLIGHSMGGLDSRHAVVDQGLADSVASVTTIGTPHLGTILADEILSHSGTLWIDQLSKVIDLRGFEDLTVSSCEKFNARAEDVEAENDVLYQTYSGHESPARTFIPLIPSSLFISQAAGDNDGLVPVTSQRWTSELISSGGVLKQVVQKSFPIPVDHLNEVGWWDPNEIIGISFFKDAVKQASNFERTIQNVYADIAQGLSDIN
jgi:triacylglycerol lipase